MRDMYVAYAYMGFQQTALKDFTEADITGKTTYHKGTVLDVQAILAAGIVKKAGWTVP